MLGDQKGPLSGGYAAHRGIAEMGSSQTPLQEIDAENRSLDSFMYSTDEYSLRKLHDLFVYSMNAVICQINPTDLSGVDERFCRHF